MHAHRCRTSFFLGKVGKFGKFSVKETAFYRLCYTLPCLRAQLQEPTWPAEGLLPHRLGHMGCTWMYLKIKSFARQSTWAWGDLGMKTWITRRHVAFWVLGGEHQRKALLPKWQGLWSQNKPKVLRSQKFFQPLWTGAQEHFEYRKGWYKSRSVGLGRWVLWNRPHWLGGLVEKNW